MNKMLDEYERFLMKKKISEAQFVRDLKTVHPNMSKEDIEWHLNLFRQSEVLSND